MAVLGVLNENSLVANIFTGPIMEKNHTSARNATKISVAETSQQWCFYMFLTKNGVAGVGSFGGHPPHPRAGDGNFC